MSKIPKPHLRGQGSLVRKQFLRGSNLPLPPIDERKITAPIRYDPLARTPEQQQQIFIGEIIGEIHQRLLGHTITPKIAGMFRAAVNDEILKVTRPATKEDELQAVFQEFGDAFFRLGQANSRLAQAHFSMNPGQGKKKKEPAR